MIILAQVLINPHHAARPDLLEVTAYSPTNRPLGCPVSEDNGTFYASFQPDEAGEWRIHVTYDDEDIENSPFKCMVFDPRAIHVRRSLNDDSIYGCMENIMHGVRLRTEPSIMMSK